MDLKAQYELKLHGAVKITFETM